MKKNLHTVFYMEISFINFDPSDSKDCFSIFKTQERSRPEYSIFLRDPFSVFMTKWASDFFFYILHEFLLLYRATKETTTGIFLSF